MNNQDIHKLFTSKKISLSTAESCTGGNIAHQITKFSGSSAYFLGGVVSYSNEAKENVLSVNNVDIEQFGAVSEQVACQMAIGVREIMQSNYAVSTTGIAGPSGGTPLKPIGTVWIGVSSAKQTHARLFQFQGTRIEIINQTTQAAMGLLIELVKKELTDF